MAFSTAAETQALIGIVGDGTADKNNFISLHSADPGDNNTTAAANEITGGAYAREVTDWLAPSGSSVTGSAVTLDVPAGTTISHWGIWSAVTGGTFIFGGPLPASETFGSNGTYSLTPTLSASD